MSNQRTLVVADTSAVINLSATGCAARIIRALPYRIAIVDAVTDELAAGRDRGRANSDSLQELLTGGLVDVVTLNDNAAVHFEELVVGPAALTLDDGEAATIAYAVIHEGTAILDERKAIRIARERFPSLHLGSSVDLFAHPGVQDDFGTEALGDALYSALRNGRMRVLPQHVGWVIGLIGADRAALCPSLPNSARSQQSQTRERHRARKP